MLSTPPAVSAPSGMPAVSTPPRQPRTPNRIPLNPFPHPMRYGDLEIDALPEGRFTVGFDKRFVPHAAGDPPRPGTLCISVTPFLVRAPEETVLVDTGLGSWAEGRGTGALVGALDRLGVAAGDVDRVVLSHLHFDHAGGAVTEAGAEGWRPTFPAADYLVQRAEATAEGYAGESARARGLVLDTLDRAGQLVWLDGDARAGRVETEVTGGHTGAHQAVRLRSGDLEAVFGGDVLGTPGAVTRRYQAKYDVDPARSQAWRDRLVGEAAERGSLLLFYHSAGAPAAFVADGPKGQRAVEPVDL